MGTTKETLETEFTCPKCHARGALVQEVALGRSVARMIPLTAANYLAASCTLCGFTELYSTVAASRADELTPLPGRLVADTPE